MISYFENLPLAARLALIWGGSLLTGSITAFSMAPVHAVPAMFIGFGLFYFLYARTRTPQSAVLAGFLFGIGYFTTGLWWIGNALLVEGNEYAWVWPLAVIGLPTLLSLFMAVFIGIARAFWNPASIYGFLAFCLSLAVSEFIRGHIFTGFPWNLYGYAFGGNLPMMQIVSVVGSYGLTLLAIFWAALPGFLVCADLKKQQKAILLVIGLITLTATYAYGSLRLGAHETSRHDDINLLIVQPNIPQSEKWQRDLLIRHFETHLDLSRPPENADIRNTDTTLIIWPETAIAPAFLYSQTAKDKIVTLLNSYPGKAYLLAGTMRIESTDDDKKYYNSLLAFDQYGDIAAVYDKTHLVPFGEFIPLQKWIPLKAVAEYSGFERGSGPQTHKLDDLPVFSALICYEIIFPGKVTPSGPDRSDWVVNITNDAWYGLSAGPHQHFNQVRFRAVEEGLPIIRSANTGISGQIGPYGRIVERTELFSQGAISAQLLQKAEEITFFKRHGDAVFLITILLMYVVLIFKIRK